MTTPNHNVRSARLPAHWRIQWIRSLVLFAKTQFKSTSIKLSFTVDDGKVYVTASADGEQFKNTDDAVQAINRAANPSLLFDHMAFVIASGHILTKGLEGQFNASMGPTPSKTNDMMFTMAATPQDKESTWQAALADYVSMMGESDLQITLGDAAIAAPEAQPSYTVETTLGTMTIPVYATSHMSIVVRRNGIPNFVHGHSMKAPFLFLDVNDTVRFAPGQDRFNAPYSTIFANVTHAHARDPMLLQDLTPLNVMAFNALRLEAAMKKWDAAPAEGAKPLTPTVPQQPGLMTIAPRESLVSCKFFKSSKWPAEFVVSNFGADPKEKVVTRLKSEKTSSLAQHWNAAIKLVAALPAFKAHFLLDEAADTITLRGNVVSSGFVLLQHTASRTMTVIYPGAVVYSVNPKKVPKEPTIDDLLMLATLTIANHIAKSAVERTDLAFTAYRQALKAYDAQASQA